MPVRTNVHLCVTCQHAKHVHTWGSLQALQAPPRADCEADFPGTWSGPSQSCAPDSVHTVEEWGQVRNSLDFGPWPGGCSPLTHAVHPVLLHGRPPSHPPSPYLLLHRPVLHNALHPLPYTRPVLNLSRAGETEAATLHCFLLPSLLHNIRGFATRAFCKAAGRHACAAQQPLKTWQQLLR